MVPYDFQDILGPGRTLGIADFLSRNPTIEQNFLKAQRIWQDWFTKNVLSEMKISVLTNQKATLNSRQPITSEDDTTECKSVKEIGHAAALILQTIEDTFKKRNDNELQLLAIKPPEKDLLRLR